MTKHRSRYQIIAEILLTAKGGALQTKIMYRAFLSYAQVKDYLPVLQRLGYLAKEGDRWKTTEAGLKFLQTWRSTFSEV